MSKTSPQSIAIGPSGKTAKPPKPYADFPLTANGNGQWSKQIRGRVYYFGKWENWKEALDRYLDEKDALQAGRTPRKSRDALTVRDLCNRFLTTKQHLLDTGEITERTFYELRRTCEGVVAAFGRERIVEDLVAEDFEALRVELAKTRGPVALGNEIQRVRSVFKYGYDSGIIEKPIRYGQGFNKPSRKTIRKARNEKGPRMFEAAEIRAMLTEAGQPLRSMILLGINCGYGASDISSLHRGAINLERSIIDYPRPKTGIHRRCPLWTETVESLQEAMASRPDPKDEADAELAFITKYGHRWVKMTAAKVPDDAICKEFGKVLRRLEIQRPGLGFYALRHTFETIGGEAKDQVAVDHIMGHAREDMASVYRERISDQRLRDVTEHVRKWLLGK